MRRAHAARVLLGLALGACSSSTDTGPPAVNLLGSWGYAGTQVSPTVAALAGTVAVASQSGHTFNGSFTATESGPGLPTRSLVGSVQGRLLDSTGLDFNVFVDGHTRRHVGRLKGDSLTGNWEVEDDLTLGIGGTFRMRRLTTP